MPKVRNWQIGREMEYPYEAAFPERPQTGRHFAPVLMDRCAGVAIAGRQHKRPVAIGERPRVGVRVTETDRVHGGQSQKH